MFDDKKILITGGTGSLGQALTEQLLKYNIKTLRILSRNESKQVEMQSKFDDDRLRFLIGDIRDKDRLSRAVEDIDIVFHTAALKQVPLIEYNPSEAIMTNIIGTQNLVMECARNHVEKVIGVGTDKAVSPLNTYGATKLLMEKILISAANQFSVIKYKTRFVSLRYGNVVASSGSVVPVFIRQIKNKQKITITDPKMTRFNITMKEAVEFILSSTEMAVGSEVFVPKLHAYNIMDVKDALMDLLGNTGYEIINVRPGEKMHELLINEYEIPYSKDLGDRYALLDPQVFAGSTITRTEIIERYKNAKQAEFQHEYSSDSVPLMSKEELKSMLSHYI
jgi:UDP-N-acetylglucosamine 4,6-dehydratase